MRFEQCRDGRRWPLETPLRLRSFRGDQRVGSFHLPLGHDAGEAFETINADPVPAGDRARIPGVSSNVIERHSSASFVAIAKLGLGVKLPLLRGQPSPSGGSSVILS